MSKKEDKTKNAAEHKDCECKKDTDECCQDSKETSEKKCCKGSKTNKAAAKAYAKAQQTAEDAKSVVEEVISEVDEQMQQEEAAKADNEPDYKLIAHKTAAEFDNYRKRVAREKEIWKRDALGDFLKEFLPAFDDLDRAIAEGEKGHSYEVIHDGAKLVRDNLWKVMLKSGIQVIDATDQKFDPRYHEAMTMIPVPDKEPDSIVEVFQPGYMIGDFVLRPAKVVVAAQPQ